MTDKWQKLRTLLARVDNLKRASALLGWDQQTYMPSRGAPARAEHLATLDKLTHELFTADEIGSLLEELTPEADQRGYDSDQASLIRVAKRDYAKARRIPPSLVEQISRTSALGIDAWERARAQADFSIFQPILERIVELEIELANRLGYQDRIYDPLLGQFEPEMTTRQVQAIFDGLKPELIELMKAITPRLDSIDDRCLHREYDPQKQWDFGLKVIQAFGFDSDRGREDKSAHPFTTGFSLEDVRITTRVDPRYLPSALFGTMHECGHALYDQGYGPELEHTPLAWGASFGVHESQSRLWENLVGRSRSFWRYFFPRLREVFPNQLADQDEGSFYRAVNKVMPSLIRVEADDVTYNLHIMLRFEMENELVEGKLKVADAPAAWNAKMKEYLGIVPPDDAKGVLQDIQWAGATIGYFPTYSLGYLFSVQLFDRAQQQIPDLDSHIENGDFKPLLGWLRQNVHRHGRKYTLDELARRITGEPLQSKYFVAYLKREYAEIYKI